MMMRYDKLEKEARKTINNGQGLSEIGTEYVERFACVSLNGQQVSYLSSGADF